MKKLLVLIMLFLSAGCISAQKQDAPLVSSFEENIEVETADRAVLEGMPAESEGVEEQVLDEQVTEEDGEVVEVEESWFMPTLPHTELVEMYYRYYTQQHKKTFERWIDRSRQYLPEFAEIFREADLPLELIFLPFAESGFNPWAYSRAGAGGMWQFMPGTARGQGLKVDWWLDERRDPYKSTRAAVKYLQYLYAEFNDWPLVLAAYNGGEGTVRRAIADSGQRDFFALASSKKGYFKKETQHYVPKFIAIMKILHNLEQLGFTPVDLNQPSQNMSLPLSGTMNLKKFAENCGLTWKEFTSLNPGFRRSVSPSDYNGTVCVPKEKGLLAQRTLKSLALAPSDGIRRYKVQQGDSLWSIARKHNASVVDIVQLNSLEKNVIQPGQWLLVAMDEVPSPVVSVKTAPEKKRAIARSRANYRVQKGDSLWSIARKFGTSTQTLLVANGLKAKSVLSIGQKLYIPDGGKIRGRSSNSSTTLVRYNVRPGDTIWGIARRFNVSAQKLLAWNKMGEDHILHPGQNLVLYLR